MPSFGYGVVASEPKTRGAFVSFSQKSASGARAVGAGRGLEPVAGERVVGDHERRRRRARAADGSTSSPHDHVLRNQSVGSTSSVASSGPWFSSSIRISTSVGEAFA